MSQDELAYAAEIGRSYGSKLAKGIFYASLKIIGRLAEMLRVTSALFKDLQLPYEIRIVGEGKLQSVSAVRD